jgi:CDP-diacylglycerol--glycerol-3-phosphate 3-phosphatidyltransferase
MTSERLKWLPNALTVGRIALSSLVFFILAGAAGALPGQDGRPSDAVRAAHLIASLILFVVAALTDFFDGYLARKLNATSPWGVILDPIADKIAIAAAILGLVVLEPSGAIAIPGFAILFREMFVSGLREGLAPRGIKLPVTLLAKWKTTAQLTALALEMPAALLPPEHPLRLAAHALLWIAALLTLWTGWEYAKGASRALGNP